MVPFGDASRGGQIEASSAANTAARRLVLGFLSPMTQNVNPRRNIGALQSSLQNVSNKRTNEMQ